MAENGRNGLLGPQNVFYWRILLIFHPLIFHKLITPNSLVFIDNIIWKIKQKIDKLINYLKKCWKVVGIKMSSNRHSLASMFILPKSQRPLGTLMNKHVLEPKMILPIFNWNILKHNIYVAKWMSLKVQIN